MNKLARIAFLVRQQLCHDDGRLRMQGWAPIGEPEYFPSEDSIPCVLIG